MATSPGTGARYAGARYAGARRRGRDHRSQVADSRAARILRTRRHKEAPPPAKGEVKSIKPTISTTINRPDTGAEVTVSQWVADNYTLTRTDDGECVDWKVAADSHGWPTLSNTASLDEAPHFGVNWTALGTVPIDVALNYAAKITTAAAAAEKFNQIIADN